MSMAFIFYLAQVKMFVSAYVMYESVQQGSVWEEHIQVSYFLACLQFCEASKAV